MKIANFVMIVVFFLCVAVQYNDPDPIRWIAIYGLALAACVLYAFGLLTWHFSAVIAVAALLWAASIFPHLMDKVIPLREIFGTLRMISEPVEEAREMGGLLIVAAWMITLTLKSKIKNQK